MNYDQGFGAGEIASFGEKKKKSGFEKPDRAQGKTHRQRRTLGRSIDNKVKGVELMDKEMVTRGGVVFENESRTLRHRRNVSNSSTSTSTSAVSCVKCEIHSSRFLRSRSDNHHKPMCFDCGLSLKQKGMRRWKTLAIVFVVKKAISEVNESANFSVNDKSKSKFSSQLKDSSTAATSDCIENENGPTPEIQSDSSTAATTFDFSQPQIDPPPETQGHEIFNPQIIAKASCMETGSWFYFTLICRMINLLIEVGVATDEPRK